MGIALRELQHCNTATLQHCNTATLQHCNTATLQHCNAATQLCAEQKKWQGNEKFLRNIREPQSDMFTFAMSN